MAGRNILVSPLVMQSEDGSVVMPVLSLTTGGDLNFDSGAQIIVTDELAFPDGTEAAPSLAPANDSDTGFWYLPSNTNALQFSSGGARKLQIDRDITVGSAGLLSWNSALDLTGSTDLSLARAAAGVLSIANTGGTGVTLRLDAATRHIFVNESTNANSDVGITINQGSFDTGILDFKSEGDVAHGMTTLIETDTYADFRKINATNGGLLIDAFSAGTVALYLRGTHTTDDTTKTTSSFATVVIDGGLKSTTTRTAVGANGNILVIANNGTATHIFDEDGDIYANGMIVAGGIATASTTGTINIPNAGTLYGRNAADDGDVNILTLDANDNVVVGSTSNYAILTAPDAAAADAQLSASQLTFYWDEAGNQIVVKAKEADGSTVKTGAIAVT